MLNINVQINGLENVKLMMLRAPERTIKEIGRAVSKSTLKVKNTSLKEVPTNKQKGGGNLKQSIRHIMINKFRGEVVAHAKYAAAVHEGTRPHIIRPRRIGYKGHPGGLYDKRTGWGVYNKVNHPGTRPNPFMDRAAQKSQKDIDLYFAQAMNNIFIV